MTDKKEKCWSCSGQGFNYRTVVIGKIVTRMKDTCYRCNGTGLIDKK